MSDEIRQKVMREPLERHWLAFPAQLEGSPVQLEGPEFVDCRFNSTCHWLAPLPLSGERRCPDVACDHRGITSDGLGSSTRPHRAPLQQAGRVGCLLPNPRSWGTPCTEQG